MKRRDDLIGCVFWVPGEKWHGDEFRGKKYRCVVRGYKLDKDSDDEDIDPDEVAIEFELEEVDPPYTKAFLSEWDIQKCIQDDGFA